MPAVSPRIYLTLPPAVYASVAELARVTGKPKAALLREFLEEAAPALAHLATLASAVQEMETDTRQKVAKALFGSVATATMNADGVTRDLAQTASRAAHLARVGRQRRDRAPTAPAPRRPRTRYPV